MEVKVKNSINLENIQNENDLKSSERFFSSKDLESNFSKISQNIINESNSNENSINIDNLHNIQEDNDANNALIFKNKKEKETSKQLITELINNNFIFIKDFSEQKLDENNKLYLSWLGNLYINIKTKQNYSYNKTLIINQKLEIPNYLILKNELENKLFFCNNPRCNSIVYMTKKQQEKLNEISKLYYFERTGKIYDYKKNKCPVCLKYKCIYCNKSSTLFNANCCVQQMQKACEINKNLGYNSVFCLVLYAPVLRCFYISCMINFEFFRALTLEKKLLQNIKNIKAMISQNYTSDRIFGTYQAKFGRISMIFISLLNIFGSICWTIPYYIYIEMILTIALIIECFSKDNSIFRKTLNKYYLLAFIPGLRRNTSGFLSYV